MSRLNRIDLKIALGLMAFTVLMAGSTSLILMRGFSQAEQAAVGHAAESLQNQSQQTLLQLTTQEAQLYNLELQKNAEVTKIAADYMVQTHNTGQAVDYSRVANVVYQATQLTRSANGLLYYDANPHRRTEILHIGRIPPDATTDRSLRDSAALEDLFPALLAQTQTGVGIYFQGPQLTFRYYPVRGLPELELQNGAAEAAQSARIEDFLVAPPNNPGRKTVWLAPYVDDAGQGLLVSANTPIYYGDEFQGFVGIDVSLTRLITRLESLRPTQNSFAFLVDGNGHLIAVSSRGIQQMSSQALTQTQETIDKLLGMEITQINPALDPIVTAGKSGRDGVETITLRGQPSLITYAPLTDLGWTLAIVAPLEEIVAEAQTVAASIRNDREATVQNTLLTMVIFFIAAMIVTFLLTRQFIIQPLVQVVRGVRAITAGNLRVSVPITSHDEIGELADSFNQMTVELERRTQELGQASTALAVKETQVKMAALVERQRLARELHDSVSQALYGIGLGARTARAQLERNPASAVDPLDYVISLAEAGLSEMRALIFELRPESLQNEGLVVALTKQAEALRARHKLEVLTSFCAEPDLSLDAKEALYRIAQEALQNIVKHSSATQVEIALQDQAGYLSLEIRDNGQGFDPSRAFPGHLGLKSMPERAAKIGGEYTVQSQPGAGTSISVRLAH